MPDIDLDALAPYPQREADVTADTLGRWLTLTAYWRQLTDVQPARRAFEAAGYPPDSPLRDAYERACSAFTAEYGLAYLLRELPMSSANRLARDVWQAYDGQTEYAFESLGEWLGEEDIDVEVLIKSAES